MWNFTVRGLLVPCLSEIEHLFKSSETVEQLQQSVKNVKAQDMFVGRFCNVKSDNSLNESFLRVLMNAEKALKSHLVDDHDDEGSDNSTQPSEQKVNSKFGNVCKNIVQHMWETQQGDEEKFQKRLFVLE
jgi:hypothetical protein